MAKKSTFKGLMAYNHIVKLVKSTLSERGVELKKGKYFQEAPDCSFRDIVNKSWSKSKGKSKRQAEKVTLSVIESCLKSGGYLKRQPVIEPTDGENISENIHYWELTDYMNKLLAEGSMVEINNSAYGGVPDLEGRVEDIEEDVTEIYSELNALSNIRNWDSSSAPTYQLFYSSETNKYTFVLVDNENNLEGIEERSKDWTEKQAEDLKRLKQQELSELTGGKSQKEKIKPLIDPFIVEQEQREAKKKADIIELELLDKKKASLMKSFEMYKSIDDKKEMKAILEKIKKIDNQIENL